MPKLLPTGHDYVLAATVIQENETDLTERAALTEQMILMETRLAPVDAGTYRRMVMRLAELGRVQQMLNERR